MANYGEFLQLGFPIIALFCFIALAVSYFLEAGKVGIPSGLPSLFTFVVSAYLILVAIFMSWGPGIMARLSVHLFILGLSGMFAVATDKRSVKVFFVVFGAITELCLIGSAAFLTATGQTSFVDVSSLDCMGYFRESVDRCGDENYLMFLRVIGAIAIFALLAAVGAVLTTIVDDGAADNSSPRKTHPEDEPAPAYGSA